MLLSNPITSLKFPSPNLSLHKNRSPKRIVKMSQAAQTPVTQQLKIIVPNKHGEKLVGLLHETGSGEIVILCHGFRSSKETKSIANIAVALENEGISSFRFDFAGNGESEGSFQYGHYSREADDLHAVVQHFSGENRIPSAILGHSKGGDVVLLYASKYHDVPTVVNISGRYDLKRGIKERLGEDFMQIIKKEGFIDVQDKKGSYSVTEESLMDRLSTDMHEACLQIGKDCRVLTVHGSADEVIAVDDALEFSKIIPNHKLHIIEGANHNYSTHQAELASVAVDFIKAALKPDKAITQFQSPKVVRSSSKSHPKRGILKYMAEAAQNSVTQQQKIIITNKHGEKLVGLLHEAGSDDIVILCHGFTATKEDPVMLNLATALENEGISSFRFDFAGNGESEGSFEYGNYWKEADDLHAVIQHFSGKNRAARVILGHSKGADVVLLYASKYHDIPTVVNVSGRYDLKAGIKERLGDDFMQIIKKEGFLDIKNKTGGVAYRVTEESMMDRLSTDMHESCLQISKECQVLTVHGSADETIPVEDASEFAKILPNHKLHIVEGADHCYTSHQAELASAVVEYIKEALQQDKATSN